MSARGFRRCTTGRPAVYRIHVAGLPRPFPGCWKLPGWKRRYDRLRMRRLRLSPDFLRAERARQRAAYRAARPRPRFCLCGCGTKLYASNRFGYYQGQKRPLTPVEREVRLELKRGINCRIDARVWTGARCFGCGVRRRPLLLIERMVNDKLVKVPWCGRC